LIAQKACLGGHYRHKKEKNDLIPHFEPSASKIVITAFSMEISSSVTAVPQTNNILRHKVASVQIISTKTAVLVFVTAFYLHNTHVYKKDNKMLEIWKNKRSPTGERNVNLKLYLCSPQGATCICIIIFLY